LAASYPLIAGKVILGENIPNQSGGFATEIFPEYTEIINVLNQDQERSSVLIYPASSLPTLIHDGKMFIGQDILGAQSNKPFLYLTYESITNANLFQKLKDIYYNFNFASIKDTNARYIIIRKDVFSKEIGGFRTALENSGVCDKLVDNKYLELYKVKDQYYQSKIFLPDGKTDEEITFSYITPVKYLIEIDNIRDTNQLAFLESYNKYWKLYPLKFTGENDPGNMFSDLTYLYKMSIFDSSHEVAFNYANGWKLSANSIVSQYGTSYYETNPDGSKNIKLLVYYKPQSYFYLGEIISGAVLLLYIGYLIYSSIIKKLKKI